MPLQIIAANITKMKVDAIVNAANNSLLGGGGVDGDIHKAAGPQLLEECRKLNGCKTGQAKITKGYNLPAKYIIHTVGPRWIGGIVGEKEALVSCYRESLKLAVEYNCESIAFPLISSGVYGYPKDKALEVAVKTAEEFLRTHDLAVYIVIFDRKAYRIAGSLYDAIETYLDESEIVEEVPRLYNVPPLKISKKLFNKAVAEKSCEYGNAERDLEKFVSYIDESFTEMLLRKIDEKGMTDAECYHLANVDRRLFYKIRKDKNYRPSKQTAIAFAIALKLPLDEAKELLTKAGFALSPSQVFDRIIEFFIINKKYDIYEINTALFAFDQPLLGA